MLKLKVINIDSLIDLTHHDCAFTEQVIHMAEDLDKTEKRWNSENSISPLVEKMYIFLLKKESMPEEKFDEFYINQFGNFNGNENVYENEKEGQGKTKNGLPGKGINNKSTEYLGFYTRDGQLYGAPIKDEPAIFICPERIFECSFGMRPSNFSDITDQELIAKVIIHEFAHAIMDLSKENAAMGDTLKELFRWVEEPFANWFVMKYFDSFGQGAIYRRVKDFMIKQPKNYRLGWNFFNSKISDDLWKEWRTKKTIGIHKDLKQVWLDFASTVKIGDDITQKIKELLK